MKFLCDVHISFKLVKHIETLGFEAIHVNNILDSSETKDSDISSYADKKNLIIITKDSDFRYSHFIKKTPKKLIKINLGNISNQKLEKIFTTNISKIQKLNSKPNFLLELDIDYLNLIEI